ncbi:MAG: hypothetical protein M1814_000932, partial [Vezdaea aestivalis]
MEGQDAEGLRQFSHRLDIPFYIADGSSGSDTLRKWLASLLSSTLDPLSLCQQCYKARASEQMRSIERRAKSSSIDENDTSSEARYARVRHYLGRVGSYIKAVRVLADVGRSSPQLFVDFKMQFATMHLNFLPPSYRDKSSINGIISRMVADPQICKRYQKEIHSQNEKFHLSLQKRIRDEYKNPKFKLRVHAEIILLDLFHRRQLQFQDGIRYIG